MAFHIREISPDDFKQSVRKAFAKTCPALFVKSAVLRISNVSLIRKTYFKYMEFIATYQSSTFSWYQNDLSSKTKYNKYQNEQYISYGEQRGNVVQSIPFVDASRDNDARFCPGTTIHASGAHPNRFSYLLRKVADITEKTTRNRQTQEKRTNSTSEK